MTDGTTMTPDAIVVGSGFGGAVSACRLAESGRKVLVLERGPRRSGNDFPRLATAKVHDWLWTSKWNGFWDLRMFHRMATLTSSGVGGGSHAYANVQLRAPEESFREGWPDGMGPETLAPYYEKVEDMLHVRPFPDTIHAPKSHAYAGVADRLGVPSMRPNLAVYFDEDPNAPVNQGKPSYVRDPFNLGVDVLQSPCLQTGECDLGCRFGAKNSVDLNYLAVAEQRHGAVVQPLSEVFAVEPEEGGYRVHYRDRTTSRNHSVWAPLAVLAGGTVNTAELLLRCREEYETLPNLSPMLGEHFSGNGDFLCGAVETKEVLDPWRGPVITTAVPYRDGEFHFYLQEGGFPPDLSFLVSAAHPDRGFAKAILHGPVGHAARLRAFYQEIGKLADQHREDELLHLVTGNTIIFLGMGQDASDGRIRLEKRWGRRPKLMLDWDNTRTQPLIDKMTEMFRQIAHELGGIYVESPLWSLLGRMITVHPLGACGIADDESQGVLTPLGEVWNYPNLFVAGGSAVPRSLGPNPALTISALAERMSEHIVKA